MTTPIDDILASEKAWQRRAERAENENERLRAALQDAKDLAIGDAPAHMIVDVCDRALAAGGKP